MNDFSPRFAGFQLGLAYIPDLDEGGDGDGFGAVLGIRVDF